MFINHTIWTDRLVLKEITEADTDLIVSARSDPAVYRYFKQPHPLTAKEHLKWFQENYLINKSLVSWIGYKDRRAVGIYSLKILDGNKASIGYLTVQGAQRKGYASEAILSIEKKSMELCDVTIMIAEIHMANNASINFIRSLGYVEDHKAGDYLTFVKALI